MSVAAPLTEKDDARRLSSVACFHADQVALVLSRKHGTLTLPAGHSVMGESALSAAIRETKEETGIQLAPDQLMFVTRLDRAKKSDAIFATSLGEEVALRGGSDADEALWHSVATLPDLMFNHRKAIQIALETLKIPVQRRGILIVFEGIDGSGKTTQIDYLTEYLERKNFSFTRTRWNSGNLLKKSIARAKKTQRLSPTLFFLLHAADMVDRYESVVVPALARNEAVVCDRYYYTGLVRDSIRGIDMDYNRAIYNRFREPDLVLHCQVDPAVAVARLAKAKGLGHYGSGMDLNLGATKEASALAYEKKMVDLYGAILPEQTVELNMDNDVDSIFEEVKDSVKPLLSAQYGDSSQYQAEELVDSLIA